ncbi:20213_t:CDS:2 [Gigaspora margarita]|uniref:20213_t:CDS:1 n=1 Tax=Gigaspora margarita TaxID=4874 RepID=A0ABN7UDG4_GIGMA|nr:20213_t:CDS:2 [Gigaspora margarita]
MFERINLLNRANLSLYNISNEFIESYSTVDLTLVNTSPINGTITLASFSNNESLPPCTLKPIHVNTTILLIPFNEGLDYGCLSYADIIENNLWLQTMNRQINNNASVTSPLQSTTTLNSDSTVTREPIAINTPTKTRNYGSITMVEISYETEAARSNKRVFKEHIKPQVVIFTSMNNGDPGFEEKYVGNLQSLSKAAPALTLMRIADMSNVQNLLNQTSYAVFIRARKNDLVPIVVDPSSLRNNEQQRRSSPRNNDQIRRVRTNKQIFETGILTISLILSFLFITIHTLITPFLSATIRNFWITRITDDVSFVSGCIILLIALHSDSISKYSHMTYTSSPEESSTENSQNPSRSSSNGGNVPNRPKRNTLEILFGRKSIVGL